MAKKKNQSSERPKEPHVLEKVRECLRAGRFTGSKHSLMRGSERNIEMLDVVDVIENGYHGKSSKSHGAGAPYLFEDLKKTAKQIGNSDC